MDFLFKGMNGDASECPSAEDMQRCPFLRNINKPTCFSFTPISLPIPVHGAKGPIFEDAPNFDMAFKLFHGKDGVVPLSGRSYSHLDILEPKPEPQFNPLAAKAATISMSAFGPGGPFSFGSFSDKWKKNNSDSSSKKETPTQNGDSSKHEALGNEWLKTGNCPIAKSYRAMSHVLPLVATALQPPLSMKLRCPPAVVAARAALARTALVKNLRPQPLPAKMLVIAALAVHAAVPFIAMLRKSVVMPKTAMALTISASILGQVIGSRAERVRLKAVAEKERVAAQTTIESTVAGYNPSQVDGRTGGHCAAEGMIFYPRKSTGPTSSSNVCF
ncbi:uncharacterized protein LOC117628224 isoform X2 [Prunus dulcis]|uniref:uncharacterized protein LOC117628224 isoform X2 n=1 Tax=Prunus dulcis TaxID=3755 RepID=UPI001482952D|nr:uncharacterized protein LOC117628224 isoform X2 [Prunus dulcis]